MRETGMLTKIRASEMLLLGCCLAAAAWLASGPGLMGVGDLLFARSSVLGNGNGGVVQ